MPPGVRSTSFLLDQLLAYWKGRTPNFGGLLETILPTVKVDRFYSDEEGSQFLGGIDDSSAFVAGGPFFTGFAIGSPSASGTDLFIHEINISNPGILHPNTAEWFLFTGASWSSADVWGDADKKGPFFSTTSTRYASTVSKAFFNAGHNLSPPTSIVLIGASVYSIKSKRTDSGSSIQADRGMTFDPPLRLYAGENLFVMTTDGLSTTSNNVRWHFSVRWHERETIFPPKVAFNPTGLPGFT